MPEHQAIEWIKECTHSVVCPKYDKIEYYTEE